MSTKAWILAIIALLGLSYFVVAAKCEDLTWPSALFPKKYEKVSGLDTAVVTSMAMPMTNHGDIMVKVRNPRGIKGRGNVLKVDYCAECATLPSGLLVPVRVSGDSILVEYIFPNFYDKSTIEQHLSDWDYIIFGQEKIAFGLNTLDPSACAGESWKLCPNGTVFFMPRQQFDRCAAVYDSIKPLIRADIVRAKAVKDSINATKSWVERLFGKG